MAYERFLDMKHLGKAGRKKSGRRRIHNRFTMGMANSVIQRLMYGFTEEIKEQMLALEDSGKV